jgi:hypothetical protein
MEIARLFYTVPFRALLTADVDVHELLDAKEILVWPPICLIFLLGGGMFASY